MKILSLNNYHMDVDKNKIVNYIVFVSALLDYEKSIRQEDLIECFHNYDSNNSGKINFKRILSNIKTQNKEENKELKELDDRFDNNGEGEIDLTS